MAFHQFRPTSITSLAFDGALMSILYAGTAGGDLVVFRVQPESKQAKCKQLHFLPAHDDGPVVAVPVRGYVISAAEKSGMAVHNMTLRPKQHPTLVFRYPRTPHSEVVKERRAAIQHPALLISTTSRRDGPQFLVLASSEGEVVTYRCDLPFGTESPAWNVWRNPIFIAVVAFIIMWQFRRFKGLGSSGSEGNFEQLGRFPPLTAAAGRRAGRRIEDDLGQNKWRSTRYSPREPTPRMLHSPDSGGGALGDVDSYLHRRRIENREDDTE
mmetsp:Transcript_15454/g.25549  ORF Transcript_15454/g.25549 Transcript_15454/m.25549 type:complete len:269 (+) Transcript_15454:64-870(+)